MNVFVAHYGLYALYTYKKNVLVKTPHWLNFLIFSFSGDWQLKEKAHTCWESWIFNI